MPSSGALQEKKNFLLDKKFHNTLSAMRKQSGLSCQISCRLSLKSEKFRTMAEHENAKTTMSHKNASTKYRRDEQKSSQPRRK